MTTSSTTQRVVVFATLAALLGSSSGCVKEDPIVVSGNRDASAAPVPLRALVLPKPDEPDEDLPTCRTCSDTLSTSNARDTLCRKNGPNPSAVRLNAVVDCVCKDKCIQECASYCSGSTRESSCLPCIINGCADVFAECDADMRPK